MLVLTACKQRTPSGVKRGKIKDKVFVKVDFETVHSQVAVLWRGSSADTLLGSLTRQRLRISYLQ